MFLLVEIWLFLEVLKLLSEIFVIYLRVSTKISLIFFMSGYSDEKEKNEKKLQILDG